MEKDTPQPAGDQADETQPVSARPTDARPTDARPTDAPAAAQRRGFRERLRTLRARRSDRSFGLAALLASTVAALVIGGAAGTAVGFGLDDGPSFDRRDHPSRHDHPARDQRRPGWGPGTGQRT